MPDPVASAPALLSGLTIEPVGTRRDARRFIRMPYAVYRDHPLWAAPLESERERFLEVSKNPWFDHGRAQLFLATRGGETVGRIAAAEDPRFNEFQGTSLGMFGMFECIDDEGVARALFDAAATWLRARGYGQMLGPVGFSTNYEWAVLIDGFDLPPTVMMPYNPRYYPRLYEACGFTKAKDLWAWDVPMTPPDSVVRLAEKLRARSGVVTKTMNLENFETEVEIVRDVYNSAWEKNWGFVPMTHAEFTQMARDIRRFGRPELVMIAYADGVPAAFSMILPDLNVALGPVRGRLTSFGVPVGLFRLLRGMKRIRRIRFVTAGVKEAFRGRGLATVLLVDALRNAASLGYTECEASWMLEDNDRINRLAEVFGGRRTKTYRAYQRPTEQVARATR